MFINSKQLVLINPTFGGVALENIAFSMSDFHTHGSAFFEYLGLRKRFFVDVLGWDIPHNDKVEMDQYDNPLAYYSLVLRDGHVVGGARTMPTTSSWGDHTYMLRDAVSGKLEDIPDGVMDLEIETPKIWECTRLVVSNSITGQAERSECLKLVVDGLISIVEENGGDRMISLSPITLLRALRKLGYDASRIGEPYANEMDGRRYAVLTMPTQSATAPQRSSQAA